MRNLFSKRRSSVDNNGITSSSPQQRRWSFIGVGRTNDDDIKLKGDDKIVNKCDIVSSPQQQQEQQQEQQQQQEHQTTTTNNEIIFKRSSSSFLRVADLEMDETLSIQSSSFDSILDDNNNNNNNNNNVHRGSNNNGEDGTNSIGTSNNNNNNNNNNNSSAISVPNYHCSSVDPPPTVERDPKERWVVLDDGNGNNSHAPIAPIAVRALALTGLKSSYDKAMWIAEGKTTRIMKQSPAWNDVVWQRNGYITLPDDSHFFDETEIFVWSGNFSHGHYGSDLPAVRSAGIIEMNAKVLLNLLVDSKRVKEYNKLSVGRTDLLTLQADDQLMGGPFGGITKVMKSESKPPMLRGTLQFTTLLHSCALSDGSGYNMVTRAVTIPEEGQDGVDHNNNNNNTTTLKSEILLGATILKKIHGHENKCLFVAVNHLRAPMVPTMIAKRLGLSAAVNFIGDLRALAKS